MDSAVIAELLLSLGAVELRTEAPFFTFASGIRSPIYTDNRLLLSDPAARQTVCRAFVEQLGQLGLTPNVVAGTATAGIPHATLLAEALDLPLVYVRAAGKGHGKGKQIEGRLPPAAQVVLVEDLISTGGSALVAAEALRAAGAAVVQVLGIFSYGFEQARASFVRAGIPCSTLLNFAQLLLAARDAGRLNDAQLRALRHWSEDPKGWPQPASAEAEQPTPQTSRPTSAPSKPSQPLASLAVAADLTSRTEIETLAQAVAGVAGTIKLNSAFVAHGPELVRALQRLGLAIFLDLKFHDIPNTAANHVHVAAEMGVDLLTVHASGGAAMLRACADAARQHGPRRPRILAVTALTSLDDEALAEAGVAGGRAEQVLRLTRLARDCGLDGVVCSVVEAERVRAEMGPDFLIVTPGVRPAGTSDDDHARVDSPQAAIDAGADMVVIGRPIYRAAEPTGVAREVASELHQALARRAQAGVSAGPTTL